MNKLKMETTDLTDKNIDKIAKLFPQVITEKESENGKIIKAIDFDLLKQELSKELVENDDERYRLDWPGKKDSILKANTPIEKTLRPCKEDSINFDETENVYIEGDNFEVLKILQESYLGKIKMIYIDPPYNTGKDFVYKDNTTQSKEEYEEELGVEDEEGGKLFKNTDTNGRFHSDWLSMMYERLVVARDLLKDDGVIFMSIDDNEVHNLRKIGDEVFGEDNFIALLSIENNPKGRKNSNYISVSNEYVLIFARNKNNSGTFFKESQPKLNCKIDNKGRKYTHGKRVLVGISTNNPVTNFDSRKNYVVYYNEKKNKLQIKKESLNDVDNSLIDIGYKRYVSSKDDKLLENTYTIEKMKELFNNDALIFKSNSIYAKDFNVFKRLKSLLVNDGNMDFKTETAGAYLKSLNIPFDFSKNINFIKVLMSLIYSDDYYILDFFAGSSTTANSVMQLNAEDGGNRKFIMTQLAEKTDEKSEAFKAGYKTISEIGIERIRRAGKKILEENKDKLKEREAPLDIGFRVYKTDSSNMKDVYYKPADLEQGNLLDVIDNVKEDRSPEDLLTQVMLDLGLTLDLSIEEKKIKDNKVFFVQKNSLVACFDKNIDFEIVDEIAKCEPLKVVFKDSCFKDDKDRINIENRFKRLSPETIVSVI